VKKMIYVLASLLLLSAFAQGSERDNKKGAQKAYEAASREYSDVAKDATKLEHRTEKALAAAAKAAGELMPIAQ